MHIDNVSRADALVRDFKQLEIAHDLLARDVAVVVSIPTGSFDVVSGRNYTTEVTLRGVARAEVRKVIKQESERLAALLGEIGVTTNRGGS